LSERPGGCCAPNWTCPLSSPSRCGDRAFRRRSRGVWPRPVAWFSQNRPVSYSIAPPCWSRCAAGGLGRHRAGTGRQSPRRVEAWLLPPRGPRSSRRAITACRCEMVRSAAESSRPAPGDVPLAASRTSTPALMERFPTRSGAKVILQGPCRYEVDSAAAATLAGQLTAGWRVRGQRSEVRPTSTLHSPLSPFSPSALPTAISPMGTEVRRSEVTGDHPQQSPRVRRAGGGAARGRQ